MADIITSIYIQYRKVLSSIRLFPYKFLGLKVGNNVIIGSGCKFSHFTCKNISLGSKMFIQNDCTFFSLQSGKNKKYGKIIIGQGTHINKHANIVSNSNITIGKNCLLAINVSIFDHEHIFSRKIHPTTKDLSKGKNIKIGDDVYIGNNSVILKGVSLGDHVVVGANSVVTKSFPKYSIIAGAPAKIVKHVQA